MLVPMPVGSAIDARRKNRWLTKFASYWSNPTRGAIEDWLDQFSKEDRDVAARMLDAVLFIDQAHIYIKFRTLLAALEGWSADPQQRVGRWAFVPFSGSAGESGDTMTHWFRSATGMTQKKYNDLFCYRSEILAKEFGPEDTIVLIDDFAGTGTQASDAWRDYFSELVADGPRVILMLVCATSAAASKIAESTDMSLHAGHVLSEPDNFFSNACVQFSQDEKRKALAYCERASRSDPKGYGNCGLLLVLAHKCPNNSLPVLHSQARKWAPLFPRRG